MMNLNKSIRIRHLIIPLILIFLAVLVGVFLSVNNSEHPVILTITLPTPIFKSSTSIEEALKRRRSIRAYTDKPINLKQVSQLLWAAQGITSPDGFRTTPSAGALYPLEIYLVSGRVVNLPAGVYHYRPAHHALELLNTGDKRKELALAAVQINSIQQGSAAIVITANFKKTTFKYGSRGKRYVEMEAGHAAENISLQIVSLSLGTVTIGSFDDSLVKSVLHLPRTLTPLYIMPIGNINESLLP